MKDFFTDQQIDQVPPFPLLAQMLVFILLLLLVFLTFHYGHKRAFQRFFL